MQARLAARAPEPREHLATKDKSPASAPSEERRRERGALKSTSPATTARVVTSAPPSALTASAVLIDIFRGQFPLFELETVFFAMFFVTQCHPLMQ
tara:strand:- start:1412 stop:1699 length:288 start_codon:yes stop_codon:yes gene_type:complete